ncbi:MAG: sulfatase-like hydrolase/transferase [Gemmataceae bacterium]
MFALLLLAAAPNVVFLLADDQRADTIAALGNPAVHTPHLDALARAGFVFRNAYCQGSTMPAVCNPSRHMLLSGRSLYRYDPKRAEGTFGDVMKAAGYVTWHVGKRGNTAQAYHKAFHHSGYLDDNKERTSGHHGREAIDRATAFLKAGWDRKKPVFLYVAFEGPHDPRVAAPEWLKRYDRAKIPLPANYLPLHPFNNGELLVRDEQLAPWPRTEAVVRKQLHDYYGCVTSIDHHVGRLVAALKEMKEYDNTVFIYSSDHGLAMGSHGLFGKQNLYEHSMKSPLVIAGPGVPKGGSDALAYLFDIFPTAAELAGAKVPAGLDGRSLVPVMRGEKAGVRDAVFLAYRDVQRAVRRGDWKLIRYPKVDVTQLFDLRDDPHELKDRSADAAKVKEMTALLADQQGLFGDKAPLTVEEPGPAKVGEGYFKGARKKGK